MTVTPITRDDPLHDYADHVSSGPYQYAAPADLDSLRELVVYANRHRVPIRIRGNGHSMNGLAVPRPGELVIAMHNFRGFRVDGPASVTVGAGASVWDAHCALESHGIEMLVYNDGNATASTLGGYLAAGGIGHTCHRHGGFWNTVESVTLVSGAGDVRVVRKGEPEFPWLFGSYGQLGIATEITLSVRPLAGGPGMAPAGTSGLIEPTTHQWEDSAWFTVFAPQPQWKLLRHELKAIAARHEHAWQERPLYFYPLPFRDFNPPLIHPYQGALVALGLWGDAKGPEGIDWPAIEGIEADVQAMVAANPDFRRYLQCEHIAPGYDYRAHYGDRIWGLFSRLKRAWDPQGLLVPGLSSDLSTRP